MYEENGSMRHQVPSNVTAICWNPHYKDLFAMGLASRIYANQAFQFSSIINETMKLFNEQETTCQEKRV